jgi:hypothetical protein
MVLIVRGLQIASPPGLAAYSKEERGTIFRLAHDYAHQTWQFWLRIPLHAIVHGSAIAFAGVLWESPIVPQSIALIGAVALASAVYGVVEMHYTAKFVPQAIATFESRRDHSVRAGSGN